MRTARARWVGALIDANLLIFLESRDSCRNYRAIWFDKTVLLQIFWHLISRAWIIFFYFYLSDFEIK